MRIPSWVVALSLLLPLLGCGKEEEETPMTLTLSRGSTISVSTSSDGKSEVSATLPPGAPGAGTYSSKDESLVDEAREAKNSLNESGVTVEITVTGKGRLLAVRHTRTK